MTFAAADAHRLGSIERFLPGFDLLPEIGVADGVGFDQVHWPLEDLVFGVTTWIIAQRPVVCSQLRANSVDCTRKRSLRPPWLCGPESKHLPPVMFCALFGKTALS
jgi:hypothetical protein